MSQNLDSSAPYTSAIQRTVMLVRIITAAMVMGILMFGGVAMSTIRNAPPAGAEAPADPPAARAKPPLGQITMLAIAFMVGGGLAATVLPRVISRNQVAQLKATHGAAASIDSVGRNESFMSGLLRVYQTQHIIRLALLEGPAFLGIIAFMIEHNASVFVVPAVSVGLMLMTFPSVDNVVRWLERVVVDDPKR